MNLIVNVDKNWAIGLGSKLLVRIPQDMKYFRSMTTGHVVVMGRKTLESFPESKPLPNRVNIVLTRDQGTPVAALLAVFVFSAAGHWLAVKIYQSKRRLVGWFTVALFLLILLVVMVLSFTVNPPQIRLFLDPVTNTYGIPRINT